MPSIVLADTAAKSKRILKSDTYQPMSMADRYRQIEIQLQADFSPTIRLLDLLPVFLSGERHATVRKQMAVGLAAVRERQEQAAQERVALLPELLAPGKTTELISTFIRPLWLAIARINDVPGDPDGSLATDLPLLFDSKSRLRDRIRLNELIRQFIEVDPVSADQRLVSLGQNVLGAVPLSSTLALSLHTVFTENLTKPLYSIVFPHRFPISALPVTDRSPQDSLATPESPELVVTRCVLHSPRFTVDENDEALYGQGVHACLGRPISNAVWSMVAKKLASLNVSIVSSKLTLQSELPITDQDLLLLTDPFIRTRRLDVKIGL